MGMKPIRVAPDTEYTSDLGLPPEQEDPGTPPSLQDLGATQSSFPKLPSPSAPRSILGTDVAPGEQISDKQMPKAEHLAENPKAAEKFQGQQDFHNTLRDFGQKDADIRGQIISLNPHDPDYLQKLGNLHTAQGAIQEEKAHYEKGHPWGSMESAHPGVFGKIGHVLGEIGSVAAPSIAEEIPGSQPYLSNQITQGQAQEKQGADLATAEERAQAAGTTAGAHELTAQTHAKTEPIKAEAVDRATTVKENTLQNQLGEAVQSGDHEKAQQILDMLKQMKGAKPVNFQDKTGTDGQGNPARALFNPDPNAATPYLKADHTPFPDFKPSPNQTTNPQVPVFVPGNTPGSAKLSIIHPGQSFDASNAVNPSQLTATNKGVIAEQGSVNSIKGYQQDFQENRPHLTPSDVESLKVLTSHAQAGIAQHLFQDAGSGVLDALVGQPFTNYTQKLMQGTMTADQYAQLSPAGQKMLFGYTHAIVANFVNMKQKLGSIGRNPDQIQAEMANIPVPYIDINPANEAFARTFRDAQSTTFNPFGAGGGGDQPAPPSNRRVIDLTHK